MATRKSPLRIAFARIFQEANAFSPLPSGPENFRRFHWLEGEELLEVCGRANKEIKGYLRNAELSGFVRAAHRDGGVEPVPLFSSLAVPSGPVTPAAFGELIERLEGDLRGAGKLDGLFLALHGSMRVQNMEQSPEGEILAAARRVVGDTPIAVTYDLHANLTPPMVDPTTALCAYRTNPHRDMCRAGRDAGTILIRTLRGEVRPVHSWRKLPIVLGGGVTIDFLAPMRAIFRKLSRYERKRNVLRTNLFMVHPFSDAADLGWAVHVITDNDPELGERIADELAQAVWEVRKVPLPPMRSVAEAVEETVNAKILRRLGPVSLIDMDDAVGTGAPGGNTHLLDHIAREKPDLRVYLPIHDPAVVESCWGADGEAREVIIRGTEDIAQQPEVTLHSKVVRCDTTDFGRTVVFDDGKLAVVVCEDPPYPASPKFWRKLGLPARKADAIVQKSLFLYRFFYLAHSFKNIPVISAGASSLDNVRNLKFDLPVWPCEDVEDWRAFDKIRRGKIASPPS